MFSAFNRTLIETCLVFLLIAGGCTSADNSAESESHDDSANEDSSLHSSSSLAAAEALMDAFNDHDPAAMASLVSPDFELYYVDDNGQAGLALTGPDELEAEMIAYFAARPNVQSNITDAIDGPVFVSFREQIVGGQSSITVYEVRENLIRRVWYYPAED